MAAWGPMTSADLRPLGAVVILGRSGFSSISDFVQHAQPVHSLGSPSLPRPPFVHTIVSGAGMSNLLSIAYDYDVLGLGPDSPWVD